MKKRIRLLSIFLFLLLVTGFYVFPVAAQAIRHEAVEETSETNGSYISRIDMQGDAVYEDGSGYTDFALWVNGKNGFDVAWFSTRIVVYIYYTAYFEYYYTYPDPYYDWAWDVPPEDLMDWTGDWDYNHNHDDVWEWEDGSQDKYSNGNNWDGTYGGGSYYSTNSQDGTYRYLGYIISAKSGDWHQFDSLLRLHIDNEEAEDWDDGKWLWTPIIGSYKKTLLNIRVKLVFKFQYHLGQWNTLAIQTHILGDGTPSGDLSSIPLVDGTVYGLQ